MEFYYTVIHPNLTLPNYKKNLESNFFKRRYESIKEIMDENRLLTVFDLYFFDMFKYLFMELRSDKRVVFCLMFTPKKVDHVPGAKRKA